MKYTSICFTVLIILQFGFCHLCSASEVKEKTVRELYILVDTPVELNDNLQDTHIIVSDDKKCIASFCRALQISGPIVLENPPVGSVNINVIPGIEYGDVNSIKNKYAISGQTRVTIKKSGKTIAKVQTHLVDAKDYNTIQIKLLGINGRPRIDARGVKIICRDSLKIEKNTHFQADARVDSDNNGVIAFRAFKGHKYKIVDKIYTTGGIVEYEYPSDITFDSGDIVWKLQKRPSLTIVFKKHPDARNIDEPLNIQSCVGITVKDGWKGGVGGVNGFANNRFTLIKDAGILRNAKELKIHGFGRPPWENYKIINPVIKIDDSSNQVANIYIGVKKDPMKILLSVSCNMPVELKPIYFISRKKVKEIGGCLENRGISIDKSSKLTPGTYHLVAGCDGYNVTVKKINIAPKDKKHTVKIKLEKSVKITGEIINGVTNKPFSGIFMDVRSSRFPSFRFKSKPLLSKYGRFNVDLFDKPEKSLLIVAHRKLGYTIVPLAGLNVNNNLSISLYGVRVYGRLMLTKKLKSLRTGNWDIYWISMQYPGFTANSLNNFKGNDYSIYLVPGEYEIYVRPDKRSYNKSGIINKGSYTKVGSIKVEKDKPEQKNNIIIDENNWKKRIDLKRW